MINDEMHLQAEIKFSLRNAMPQKYNK